MTTFLRAFAIMLAFTGFSAANSYSTSTPVSAGGGSSVHAMDGTGLSGAPVCTNSLPNCGLQNDGN